MDLLSFHNKTLKLLKLKTKHKLFLNSAPKIAIFILFFLVLPTPSKPQCKKLVGYNQRGR